MGAWAGLVVTSAFPIELLFASSNSSAMAHVVQSLDQPSNYKDSQAKVDRQKQNELLSRSTTLYVRSPLFHSTTQLKDVFRSVT